MLRGSIEIRTTKVYGNPAIYPACASAQMIANCAGTKTITVDVLRRIMAAGIQVQQSFPNGDCLTVETIADICYP